MSAERLSGVLLEALETGQWQDVDMEGEPADDFDSDQWEDLEDAPDEDEPGEDLEEAVGFSSPLWGGAMHLMRTKDSVDKFRATIGQMGRPGRIGGLADMDPSTRQEVEVVDKEAKSLERQLIALHDAMVRVAGRAKKLDRAMAESLDEDAPMQGMGQVPWHKGREADDAVMHAYRCLMELQRPLKRQQRLPVDMKLLDNRIHRALRGAEETRKATYEVKTMAQRAAKMARG